MKKHIHSLVQDEGIIEGQDNLNFFTMYAGRHTLLAFLNIIVTYLVHIQATKHNEDTNSCTATNYHHRNYQAHTSFAFAEEEEHQKLVHSLALKKPLAMRH
jgi:hypothetical protein